MAGITGERSIVVDAPAEAVFEYISDFSRHTEWCHQVTEVIQDSDGTANVGTTFRAREQAPKNAPLPMRLMFPLMLRMVGMEKHTKAEVTEWKPKRILGWKAEAPLKDGSRWMRAEWRIELEPQNGSTRVTQHFRYLPEHDRAKKMLSDEQEAAERIGTEVSGNLQQLKQILESKTAGREMAATASRT